jgi:hypothetical protein
MQCIRDWRLDSGTRAKPSDYAYHAALLLLFGLGAETRLELERGQVDRVMSAPHSSHQKKNSKKNSKIIIIIQRSIQVPGLCPTKVSWIEAGNNNGGVVSTFYPTMREAVCKRGSIPHMHACCELPHGAKFPVVRFETTCFVNGLERYLMQSVRARERGQGTKRSSVKLVTVYKCQAVRRSSHDDQRQNEGQ